MLLYTYISDTHIHHLLRLLEEIKNGTASKSEYDEEIKTLKAMLKEMQ